MPSNLFLLEWEALRSDKCAVERNRKESKMGNNVQKQFLTLWQDAMRFGLMGGRPYSEVCIKTYSKYVEKFLDTYGEVTLENFKKELIAIPIEMFGKRLKLYEALNCFVRYLIDEKHINEDYLIGVKRYKPRRHLPPRKITVDQAGLDKLMTSCNNIMDKLIVILLSQTGLRVTEAASLQLNDIDFENNVLTVRLAKWGKTRRVGLPNSTIEILKNYVNVRLKVESGSLFINSRGLPIDRFGIRVRLEKLGRKAKIKVTPHALRRAFVTLNANKGRPLVMLQIACGHNDISTTRSYCMTSEDETVDAMRSWE